MLNIYYTLDLFKLKNVLQNHSTSITLIKHSNYNFGIFLTIRRVKLIINKLLSLLILLVTNFFNLVKLTSWVDRKSISRKFTISQYF